MRCDPIPGYFDSGDLNALACDKNCALCTSFVNCLICQNGYFMQTDGKCYSSCPLRSYGDTNGNTCQTCSFGCYSCVRKGTCTACN